MSLNSLLEGEKITLCSLVDINQKSLLARFVANDILFCVISQHVVQDFVHRMNTKFEMSSVSELTYFLGLQINQMSKGTFISQSKYARNIVTKIRSNYSCLTSYSYWHSWQTQSWRLGYQHWPLNIRSMIGSLLYLRVNHPDICYNVGVCIRSHQRRVAY